MDIRKQWKRLLAIAAGMLGYELTGKKRSSSTSATPAQRGRAARHLLAVVKMMGDTSVATVNRHYFNLEDDVMQEIIDGWAVADVEVFAADLKPVCAETAPDDDVTAFCSGPAAAAPRAQVSIACCRSRSLASLARASRRCHAGRKCARSACAPGVAQRRT